MKVLTVPEAAPPRPPAPPFLPEAARVRLAAVLLGAVFAGYLLHWLGVHFGLLFDPLLHNDDARQWLFPLHRWGPERALAEDPLALQYLAMLPPAVRGLYRVLVPWAGVYGAPKLVQGLAFAVVGLAGWRLGRARGAAAGLLLVFAALHTTYVVNRIAGGFARAFAFPALFLWASGAFARCRPTREAAAALAALAYPMAAALVLAAEGAFQLMEGRRELGPRLLRLAALGALCSLLILPAALSSRRAGRAFTIEDAAAEPAFSRPDGRLKVLPFPTFADVPAWADGQLRSARKLLTGRESPEPSSRAALAAAGVLVPAALVLAIFLLGRLSPEPRPAFAVLAGALACYVLARAFAFRLFLPQRYFEYAAPLAGLLYALPLAAFAFERSPEPRRTALRRAAAAAVMLAASLGAPRALKPDNGMNLDGLELGRLWDAVRLLPVDARVAAFPMDVEGTSFWGRRSLTPSDETLQPMLVESWAENKALALETLDALHATDRGAFLAYAERRGITQLILTEARYREGYGGTRKLWEPLKSRYLELVAARPRESLVLAAVPASSVLLREQGYLLVDVARLRRAWGR